MNHIQVFIISWSNQHDNAVSIAKEVRRVAEDVSIIYSDPDPLFSLSTEVSVIKRADHLFFGDKFKACLDGFHAKIMLLIHADCKCNDWAGLVLSCHAAMRADSQIGVWAPLINYTGFNLARTRIGELRPSGLNLVAHTDSIVFAMPSLVVERMRKADYVRNIHGWGIGWLAVAYAYANKMYAVVDRSIFVHHPRPRGYSSEDAGRQREEFLRQLLPEERIQYLLLQSHMRLMDLQKTHTRTTSTANDIQATNQT